MATNVQQLPLSDKLWAWFDTNRQQALTGAVVLAVVGLIAWFFVWRHNEKEAAAGEALSSVETAQAAAGPNASADRFLKVAAEYPKAKAGRQALLLAAGTLFSEGKYQEAQAQFDRFVRQYRDSQFMPQALLGIATCLDAAGKTDQAVTAYKDLIARHPSETFIPQGKFALARLYVLQDKPELAKDLFEEVERSGDPFFAPEAGMRVEELIAKYPKLAPPPAPQPVTSSLMPGALLTNRPVVVSSNPPVVPTLTNAVTAPSSSNSPTSGK